MSKTAAQEALGAHLKDVAAAEKKVEETKEALTAKHGKSDAAEKSTHKAAVDALQVLTVKTPDIQAAAAEADADALANAALGAAEKLNPVVKAAPAAATTAAAVDAKAATVVATPVKSDKDNAMALINSLSVLLNTGKPTFAELKDALTKSGILTATAPASKKGGGGGLRNNKTKHVRMRRNRKSRRMH